MERSTWSLEGLWGELDRFRADLLAAGLSPTSVESYTQAVRRFLRWLSDQYRPRVQRPVRPR
jgi:hypothetical protein